MLLPALQRLEYGRQRPGPYSASQAHELMAGFSAINEAVDLFEREAWYAGLQAAIQAVPQRGMSGEANGLKLLTWVCAGRCMLTIEGGGESVTLITADNEAPYQRPRNPGDPKMGPMGMQSVDATAAGAVRLITRARDEWRELGLQANENVTWG